MDVLSAYKVDTRMKVYFAERAQEEAAAAASLKARAMKAEKTYSDAADGLTSYPTNDRIPSLTELEIDRDVLKAQAELRDKAHQSFLQQRDAVDARMVETAKANPWLVGAAKMPSQVPEEDPFDQLKLKPAYRPPEQGLSFKP